MKYTAIQIKEFLKTIIIIIIIILINFLVCVTITLNIRIEVIAILRNYKNFIRDSKVLLLCNVSMSFKLRLIFVF